MKSSYLFEDMKWSDLAKLAMRMRPMRFMIGEIVYNEGDLNNGGFFVLESGYLQTLVDGSHSEYLLSGSCFGERALLHTNCRRTSTIAVVPESIVRKTFLIKSQSLVSRHKIRKAQSLSERQAKELAIGKGNSSSGCCLWMLDRATYLKHARHLYVFANARLRQAIYAQIPKSQKQKIHSIVATSVSNDDENLIMTAHHMFYSDASMRNKVEYMEKALSKVSDDEHNSKLHFLTKLLSIAFDRDFSRHSVFSHFDATSIPHTLSTTLSRARSLSNVSSLSNLSIMRSPGSPTGGGVASPDDSEGSHRQSCMVSRDKLYTAPINADFLAYASSEGILRSNSVDDDDQQDEGASFTKTSPSRSISPSSNDAASFSRTSAKSNDWARRKVAHWFVELARTFLEEGSYSEAFECVQIALMYLKADAIDVRTTNSITTNARNGCLDALCRMWCRKVVSSNLDNLSSVDLMLATEAYEVACESIEKIARRELKNMPKMPDRAHESVQAVFESTRVHASSLEMICIKILRRRGETPSDAETMMSVVGDSTRGEAVVRKLIRGSSKFLDSRVSLSMSSSSYHNLSFAKVTNWNDFDIFSTAATLTHGTVFPSLFGVLFDATGFNVISPLNVSRTRLFDMLRTAEMTYCNPIQDKLSHNPYHNALHGADVMCSAATIFGSLSRKHVPREAFSSLIIFTTGLASLLHDYKHLGVNNGYLQASKHPLCLEYNNSAVLEHMHAAEALKLIVSTGAIDSFDQLNTTAFRFLLSKLILCTDFSRGMKSVELVETAFRDVFEGHSNQQVVVKKLRKSFSTCEGDVSGSTSLVRSQSAFVEKRDLSTTTVANVLGLVIECADIAHPAKPLQLHKRWSVMVSEEFFRQGEREREVGLSVSPMCDRTLHDKDALAWGRSQQGFIKFLVARKFKAISTICENSSRWERCIARNQSFWSSKDPLTGFKRLHFELNSVDHTYCRAVRMMSFGGKLSAHGGNGGGNSSKGTKKDRSKSLAPGRTFLTP